MVITFALSMQGWTGVQVGSEEVELGGELMVEEAGGEDEIGADDDGAEEGGGVEDGEAEGTGDGHVVPL